VPLSSRDYFGALLSGFVDRHATNLQFVDEWCMDKCRCDGIPGFKTKELFLYRL
jgi:hypothetical protein